MINVFFHKVYVRFLTSESVEIKWETEPSIEDPNNVAYEVQSSENPEVGFTPVSPPLIDLFLYRDKFTGYDSSKYKIKYYRVKAYKLDNPGESTTSPVEYVHEDPYDDGNSPFQDPVVDIVRRNNLILEHPRYRVGKPCVIYQKRTHGQRCKCFDPITQRVTSSQCKLCLGTGRIEGYHSGIEDIAVNFVSLPKQRIIQYWGDVDPGDTQAWMSNFPLLKPEDIIANKLTGDFWMVKRIRTSMHLIVSKQTLLIRKLNFDDVKTRLSFEARTFRL